MDGITIALNTAVITIMISLFIAVLIKVMVTLLNIFTKPEAELSEENTVSDSADEADIATVIAIAKSRKRIKG